MIKKRLTWKAATGPLDAPPTSFDVLLNGAKTATVTTLFADLDLDPAVAYQATVIARDANSQATSDPLTLVLRVVGKPFGLDVIDVP